MLHTSTLWFIATIGLISCASLSVAETQYTWPVEDSPHEATWLQWPHNYGWDPVHKQRYQPIWLEMVKALHTGEQVRIITYNRREKKHLLRLLEENDIDMAQIQVYTYKTDDVWIRDDGPIFVTNQDGETVVQDWEFNGWGEKADWFYDDYIPNEIAWELGLEQIDIPMVLEGGAIQLDGAGTLMAKRSSILDKNRNPGMTQSEAEEFFRQYLGVTNFIWLEGISGMDLTDDHIDGTARFVNENTILTMKPHDFILELDFDVLTEATNAKGEPYKIVHLPLTASRLPKIRDYGLYMNYYVGNEVVIFPVYNDPNDDKAARIVEELYPTKKLVRIDFTELCIDGGAAHAVALQQPKQISSFVNNVPQMS